ncbi:ABC transporter substrate-binding protein [Streptomyces hoynatensis]|uniref:ABC transporter substrate-binding protein n=1 Tax=Streptomyces hoynatensis TaxID=1141874 RepID=A0A3A9YCJ2_9ACTN|nr:ABC transporter substrate-binding protein [Streptomyces hoynatensis]RKN34959.1 ABC transporter substrate-binding protein [Streptomyces hoynatensis]
MSHPRSPRALLPTPLPRRAFLATGTALGATALAACSSGPGASANSGDAAGGSAAAGAFSFTDDRGETVRLDAVPERIVAYVGSAAALLDYGIACVGVFGPARAEDGAPSVLAGGLDLDRLTSLGNAWGEFDIERYAGLRPQLLVSDVHTQPDLWWLPEDTASDILGLAPGVGIANVGPPLRVTVRRYAELAGALGADLGSAAVTGAKARFDAAAEAVRQAARDRPGLRVLAVSATEDKLWFCVPRDLSDLTYYQELGVGLVTPRDPDEGGTFQSVSWENAGLYPADLILLDDRAISLQPGRLEETKPTWRALPAVRAGQVAAWSPEPTYSYAGCAPALENLAEAIRAARVLG